MPKVQRKLEHSEKLYFWQWKHLQCSALALPSVYRNKELTAQLCATSENDELLSNLTAASALQTQLVTQL